MKLYYSLLSIFLITHCVVSQDAENSAANENERTTKTPNTTVGFSPISSEDVKNKDMLNKVKVFTEFSDYINSKLPDFSYYKNIMQSVYNNMTERKNMFNNFKEDDAFYTSNEYRELVKDISYNYRSSESLNYVGVLCHDLIKKIEGLHENVYNLKVFGGGFFSVPTCHIYFSILKPADNLKNLDMGSISVEQIAIIKLSDLASVKFCKGGYLSLECSRNIYLEKIKSFIS